MDFRNIRHIAIGILTLVCCSVLVVVPEPEPSGLEPPVSDQGAGPSPGHGTEHDPNPSQTDQGVVGSDADHGDLDRDRTPAGGSDQGHQTATAQESGTNGDVRDDLHSTTEASSGDGLSSEEPKVQETGQDSHKLSAPPPHTNTLSQPPDLTVEGAHDEAQSEKTEPPSGNQQNQEIATEQALEDEQQSSGQTLKKLSDPEPPTLPSESLTQPHVADPQSPDTPPGGSMGSDVTGTDTVTEGDPARDAGKPAREEMEEGKDVEKDFEPPKEGEKMPSFDEWKQKMLAEQAKQEKTKQMEAQGSQPVFVSKQSTKSRVNYASMTCGAKVLATNPEAKNPGSILTENKDQYMIQPCHARKWFVVELCEPVTVRSLEIANLELFSSLPESFVVHISDRYPTKEWKPLGIFKAREERTIQNFQVSDEDMFAKYIKVELQAHYGREHYCPLTILRVYGTTVTEDDEESDHSETNIVETQNGDEELEVAKEPANLFTTATDTVLSLVKTVLSPGEKEETVEKMDSVVKMNTTARNYSSVNDTAVPAVDTRQSHPCTPTVPSGGTDHVGGTGNVEGPTVDRQTQPQTPDALVSDGSISGQGCQDTGDVTTGDDVTQTEEPSSPPVVTLIETSPPVPSLQTLKERCQFCTHGRPTVCRSARRTFCGYYKLLQYIYPTSCVHTRGRHTPDTRPATAPSHTQRHLAAENGGKVVKSQRTEPTRSTGTLDVTEDVRGSTPVVAPPGGTQDRYESGRVVDRTSEFETSNGYQDIKIKPSHAGPGSESEIIDDTTEPSTATLPPETPLMTATPTGVTSSPPGSESCDTPGCQSDCSSAGMGPGCTMGPDIVQIRPTTTDDSMDTTLTPPPQTHDHPVDDSHKTPQLQDSRGETPQKPAASTPPQPHVSPDQNGMKNIYAEIASHGDLDIDFDSIPALPDDQEPVQKLSSGRKETAFMRLKNRIKELELNLNLSSRYLEELSQRYRRQMEQMYLSLNKTIQKLANTSRTAEQRDIRQQVNISELTKRIKILDDQVKALTEDLTDIHTQVLERHLFLLMVEGVVFLLIITWLLNRRPQVVKVQTTDTVPTSNNRKVDGSRTGKPQGDRAPGKVKKPSHPTHKRRNSIDTTPTRPSIPVIISQRRSKDDIGLRLSGSESSLGIGSSSTAGVGSTEAKDCAKKKKKKKQGKGSMATSKSSSQLLSNHLQQRPLVSSTSNTKLLSEAGIIFSSHAGHQEVTSSSGGATSSGSCDSSLGEPSTERRPRRTAGTRRSLDLHDFQTEKHLVNGNRHKRQGSHGSLTSGVFNGKNVTDVGRADVTGHCGSANGRAGHIHMGSRPPDKPGGWKSWFPGVQK